ncbi:type VI secretion system tip protein VgrG [Fluviispira vulneris]|uniref:type VI secretion system tip protein VgrG n=1 Tax=Fluviispira vulneris TaxID=2763012 RepID=UPI0016453C04|nr:type VI secretion system tip protein VgrG [Fluviispira vulneris]
MKEVINFKNIKANVSIHNDGPISKGANIESFEVLNDTVSELFTINASVNYSIQNSKIDFEEFLAKDISFKIEFLKQKNPRFFSGIISDINIKALMASEDKIEVQFIIKPYLWLLTKNNGYRAWSDLNSKEVIDNILKIYKNKYSNFQYKFKIYDPTSLIKRTNTIQYGESDYDFICRLLDEDHLNYFFIHGEKESELIITDELESYFENEINKKNKPLQEQIISKNQAIYNSDLLNDRSLGYEHAFSLKFNKISTLHCDFKKVTANVKTIKPGETSSKNGFCNWTEVTHHQKSEVPFDPKQAFAEKELVRRNSFHNKIFIQSNLPNLEVGREISIKYHSNENMIKKSFFKYLENEYRIIKIDHKFKRDLIHINEQSSIIYDPHYYALITLIPKSDKLNKKLSTQKQNYFVTTAYVHETQTEEETLKSFMRIRISFFWQNEKSSSEVNGSPFVLARIAQIWASNESGSFFIPSPGDEVLVLFENDIDSPIVIGSLYNNFNKCKFLIDKDEENKGKMRGFVIANEHSFILHSKDYNSSFDFRDKSQSLDIHNKAKMKIDEKTVHINLIDKTKINLDDEGKMELENYNSEFKIKDSFEVRTKKVDMEGNDIIRLNSMKIKK